MSPPTPQRDQHCVLIADDDLPTRYAVARSLRAAGYKTMEAASGAEALDFAQYVSAIILDVHLPDLYGYEVCRLLRADQKTSRLPVIHLTSKHVTPEDRRESLLSGANAYFTSPVTPSALVTTLDTLILAVSDPVVQSGL